MVYDNDDNHDENDDDDDNDDNDTDLDPDTDDHEYDHNNRFTDRSDAAGEDENSGEECDHRGVKWPNKGSQ